MIVKTYPDIIDLWGRTLKCHITRGNKGELSAVIDCISDICHTTSTYRINDENDVLTNNQSYEIRKVKIDVEFAKANLDKAIAKKEKQVAKKQGTFSNTILTSLKYFKENGHILLSGVNEWNSINAISNCGFDYEYLPLINGYSLDITKTRTVLVSDIIFWKKQ
jgi:hypothetical protein